MPRSRDESLRASGAALFKVCYLSPVTEKGWIIVEKVSPGRHKFGGTRYPRSKAMATQEEAEALKTAYPPEHGGEIIVIPISEFYSTKRPRQEE